MICLADRKSSGSALHEVTVSSCLCIDSLISSAVRGGVLFGRILEDVDFQIDRNM